MDHTPPPLPARGLILALQQPFTPHTFTRALFPLALEPPDPTPSNPLREGAMGAS